jgi:hypothetical protein
MCRCADVKFIVEHINGDQPWRRAERSVQYSLPGHETLCLQPGESTAQAGYVYGLSEPDGADDDVSRGEIRPRTLDPCFDEAVPTRHVAEMSRGPRRDAISVHVSSRKQRPSHTSVLVPAISCKASSTSCRKMRKTLVNTTSHRCLKHNRSWRGFVYSALDCARIAAPSIQQQSQAFKQISRLHRAATPSSYQVPANAIAYGCSSPCIRYPRSCLPAHTFFNTRMHCHIPKGHQQHGLW